MSDPSSGCPLQELTVTADKTSGGAHVDNSVHVCIKEEEVLHQDSDRQEEIQVSRSSLEGKLPALQNREADCELDQGQEVLDKNCAKFTDVPAGDCPDSLLKIKVSDM